MCIDKHLEIMKAIKKTLAIIITLMTVIMFMSFVDILMTEKHHTTSLFNIYATLNSLYFSMYSFIFCGFLMMVSLINLD